MLWHSPISSQLFYTHFLNGIAVQYVALMAGQVANDISRIYVSIQLRSYSNN